MKPTRASELRRMLAERGITPSRAMGQNFLVDANILRILIDAAGVTREDDVLEIGPGAGALTDALLDRARRVVAVEKDARLCEWLRERFSGVPSLTLIQSDALEADLAAILSGGCRIMVSNLPYSAGTRILMRLVETSPPPDRMLVTLQTEVGERLAAAPGSRDYGLVSVHVQRLYEVSIVRRIPGSCFFPPPEVQSSVVRLDLRPLPLAEPRSMPRFRALLKGAFTRRRKQIQRVLQDMGWLPRSAANDDFEPLRRIGIDPAARPETLSVEQWGALADAAEDWGAPALDQPEESA